MNPHRVAIITDSTCDIPNNLREQYGIQVVPLTIVWDNDQYLDGVELTAEDFYKRLLVDPHHPTTSQPTPAQFLQAFQQAKEQGAEEIITLVISSAMSGTIHSVEQAAANFDLPVHIHDSKTNSMGLGWQALAAARARDLGASVQEILVLANKVREKMVYVISLDTIDYLVKGGRIGGAVRFVNSVLNIKPQIRVNHVTGKVEAGIPARSRDKAVESVFVDFFKRVDTTRPLHITVLHNAALEEAQALAEKIKAEFHPAELFISIVSPVLGVHTGPRAIALCGYGEP